MKKLLKIRFVKFEKALVAQQLVVVGDEHFDETEHVKLDGSFYLCEGVLSLINRATDERIKIDTIYFSNNTERDEYLEKVVKWISVEQFSEQFSATRKLKVGKPCMVSLSEEIETKDWVMARLLAILPEHIKNRYITQSETNKEMFTSWTYARPVSISFGPKIDGDVYTWEMEVAE